MADRFDVGAEFAEHLLSSAATAARAAGAIALERFLHVRQVTQKGVGVTANIVTEVDLLCEKAIIAHLHDTCPDHNIVSEESPAVDRHSDWTWVIDPIDGTLNYACGLGHWCVSVGLVWRGAPLAGVIYDPIRDELFAAAPGMGASLNGRRITASAKKDISHALVAFDLGYDDNIRQMLMQAAEAIRPHVQGLRLLGSGALSLAYVAAGRIDAYFHLSLYEWDLAAALSIIREAGGVSTTWDGQPAELSERQVVAAGPRLHGHLRGLLPSGRSVSK